MIKIYFKSRFISITKEKLKGETPGFQAISMHEVGDLKIQINRFTANNQVKHLNIFGTSPERSLAFLQTIFDPVTAAGGIVSTKSGLKLFIFRNGKWDLPKGKAEKGESPEICALREVSEECGMDMNALSIHETLGKTYHIYKQNRKTHLKTTHWYGMMYSGNTESLEPQLDEGIQRCVWVDKETILPLMKNTYDSIQNFLELIGLLKND